MYWRTKQNLDYAYLMIYAARMGKLYLQLEDDIEAAADYTYAFGAKYTTLNVRKIFLSGLILFGSGGMSLKWHFHYSGTVLKYAERSEWFIIELSTLGYIGKLMRSKDIPSLAGTFWEKKLKRLPCDTIERKTFRSRVIQKKMKNTLKKCCYCASGYNSATMFRLWGSRSWTNHHRKLWKLPIK